VAAARSHQKIFARSSTKFDAAISRPDLSPSCTDILVDLDPTRALARAKARNAEGGIMADVAECIAKLSQAGKITGKIADEALEFFQHSKAEYSTHLRSAGES
jgi:hypothetical protein